MDAFQQFVCWLVGGILRNQLSGEGAGEEGRRQLIHLPARLRQPLLQLVGQREQAPPTARLVSFGQPFPKCSTMFLADHGLTVMLDEVLVMLPLTVSVALMVWLPAVFKVAEKIFTPAVRVAFAGNTA